MTNLELSAMEVRFLKDCILSFEEKLLTDIKRKTEILKFPPSEYITDEFMEMTNLSIKECFANLSFCKSLYYDLTH